MKLRKFVPILLLTLTLGVASSSHAYAAAKTIYCSAETTTVTEFHQNTTVNHPRITAYGYCTATIGNRYSCPVCGSSLDYRYVSCREDPSCDIGGIYVVYDCAKTTECAAATFNKITIMDAHSFEYCSTCKRKGISEQEYWTNGSGGYSTSYSAMYYRSAGIGHMGSSTCNTGYYYNTQYAYRGSSSSIKVYPITTSGSDGISVSSITVTGNGTATKTDYVYPGNTVTLSLAGTQANCGTKVIINGTEYIAPAGSTTYSFTMPEADTTVEVSLAKRAQTISVTSTINTTYNAAPFNLGASVTE